MFDNSVLILTSFLFNFDNLAIYICNTKNHGHFFLKI